MRRAEKWEIEDLIESEREPGVTHIAIGCDEEDCEFFAIPIRDINAFLKGLNKKGRNSDEEESSIDEIFNLSLPLQDQLNEYRSWHTESHKPKVIAKNNKRRKSCLKDAKVKQKG